MAKPKQPEDRISQLAGMREKHLAPLAESLRVELMPSARLRAPPTVLLLGNHSSGKSSTINHLLGRDIQRTGVAPTDDCFTILMHGEQDRRVDGQALTTNPNLPFSELSQFGPGLVQHLVAQEMDVPLLSHVRLVDSPGMIDGADNNKERPYDFAGVVRWFAEYADLVLLFFDPEKPGTTGETLEVLARSLMGIDHKLRIVMNKIDLFDSIRDFARTYGALCWNLSRSLPTKDLPHIYTTVIPQKVRQDPHIPLEDFAAALLELEQYIAGLPDQRFDDLISRTISEAEYLSVQVRIIEQVRHRKTWAKIKTMAACFLPAVTLGLALAFYWEAVGVQERMWMGGGVALLAVLMIVLPGQIGRWVYGRARRNLDGVYQDAFEDELIGRSRDDDLRYQWEQAKPNVEMLLDKVGLTGIPKTSHRQVAHLQRTIGEDLPKLR